MADVNYIKVKNSQSSLPKRRLIIKLRNSKGETYIVNEKSDICNVKFSYKRSYGGLSSGVCEISNLDPIVVNKFVSKNYLESEANTLTCYAGYEEVGKGMTEVPMIYQGYILWATITQGRPDTTLHIECMENYPQLNNYINVSFNPEGNYVETIPMLDWVVKVVSASGLRVDTSAFDRLKVISPEEWNKYQSPIRPSSIDTKVMDFLVSIMGDNYHRIQFVLHNGTVYLYPNDNSQRFYLSKLSVASLKNEGKFISADVNANPQAIMIGIPTPSLYGIKVRALFNDNFNAGDIFALDSKTTGMSIYNIPYQALEVAYNLENRGQNWYQDISAIRYYAPKDSQTVSQDSLRDNSLDNTTKLLDDSKIGIAKKVSRNAVDNTKIRFPAVVKAYYPNTNTVCVSIPVRYVKTQMQNGNRTYGDWSDIQLPVRTSFGGGFGISYSIKVGDTGWAVGSDLDVNSWRISDEFPKPVNPIEWGKHKLEWGYFEPEIVYNKGNGHKFTKLGENDTFTIQSLDGTMGIILSNDGIKIVSPKGLTISTEGSNTIFEQDIEVGGISFLNHVHSGVDRGSGNTNAPVKG